MTAAESRTVEVVIIHTAKTLPSTEDPTQTCEHNPGWDRKYFLRCNADSDGAGAVLGSAVLVQDFGHIKPALDGLGNAVDDYGIEPDIANQGGIDILEGLLVRLSKRQPGEADKDATPYWYGVIQSHSIQPTGDVGGQALWECMDLSSALDQIVIGNGFCMPTQAALIASGTVVQLGFLPEFNKLPNGDRSAAQWAINGSNVYVHDLATVRGTGTYWTGRQILDMIMATHAQPYYSPDQPMTGWEWAISDPDNCLTYVPESLDLDGCTVLEAVNTIVNPRRAMTWYLSVVAGVATINVVSTTPTALAAGTFTVPMSSRQCALDTTNNPWISNLSIEFDDSQTCDVLAVQGNHPWAGITTEYSGLSSTTMIGQDDTWGGWTAAQFAIWDDGDKHNAHGAEPVWRVFNIAKDWSGEQRPYAGGNVGLADTLDRSAINDSAYGYQGLNGTRRHTGGSEAPPAAVLKTERHLPIGLGFINNRLGDRQPPILVTYDGSDYVSQVAEEESYQVSVNDEPPRVEASSSDNGNWLKENIGDVANAKIYFTIGVRESKPLIVSWHRNPADWPRALPRTKVINVKKAEKWYMVQDCVTGVNTAGTAVTTSGAEVVIRDDTNTLRSVLAMARSWFTTPSVSATWTDRGAHDVADTYRPGRLLNTLQVGGLTVGGRVYDVNNVITKRKRMRVEREGCDMWDTSYETARVIPDIEGIL